MCAYEGKKLADVCRQAAYYQREAECGSRECVECRA